MARPAASKGSQQSVVLVADLIGADKFIIKKMATCRFRENRMTFPIVWGPCLVASFVFTEIRLVCVQQRAGVFINEPVALDEAKGGCFRAGFDLQSINI
jgi:hypothetical protein